MPIHSTKSTATCAQCGTTFATYPSRIRPRNFCSRQCNTLSQTHGPADFWDRVDTSGDCWLWTGYRDTDGYGKRGVDHGTKSVHRYAWELTHGPIPAGFFVCHHCDNPPCVRPDHLFLGTHTDNMRDASRKGRRPSGESHWFARLNHDQVTEIRRRYASGEVIYSALARDYGVKYGTIRDIIRGKTWKH